MKSQLLACATVFMTAICLQAAPFITVGTPGDANLATPTGPSPKLGGTTINFDGTSSCTLSACASLTLSGVTFSSPDGLLIIPDSTQSFPNELFDTSSDGSANLTLLNTVGRNAIGVGIADSDPGVTITIQALDASGVAFGTAFTEMISELTVNPGNGYFVVSDTSADIFGLQITQSTGGNFSGLAIDDVQLSPEPSTYLLLSSGAALLFALRKRLRA